MISSCKAPHHPREESGCRINLDCAESDVRAKEAAKFNDLTIAADFPMLDWFPFHRNIEIGSNGIINTDAQCMRLPKHASSVRFRCENVLYCLFTWFWVKRTIFFLPFSMLEKSTFPLAVLWICIEKSLHIFHSRANFYVVAVFLQSWTPAFVSVGRKPIAGIQIILHFLSSVRVFSSLTCSAP